MKILENVYTSVGPFCFEQKQCVEGTVAYL